MRRRVGAGQPKGPVAQGTYDLALDQARRELDRQNSELASLRDRAVALLGIGGTLAAIIGGLAIRDSAKLGPFTYLAVGAFCLGAIAIVMIIRPIRVHFGQDPGAIIVASDTSGVSNDDVVKHVATQMNEQYAFNKPKIDRLTRYFGFAIGTFVVQVLSLLLDLRGR